jgi:hypothetical protein
VVTSEIFFCSQGNLQSLDFIDLPGFPNTLPIDEYFLRNGPKFNGDDIILALKHISNFRDFIVLLRIKNEDVFFILFYDLFQGKCRSWDKGFHARSMRSIIGFWAIFLETWMEKPEFVEDSLLINFGFH